MQKSKERRQNYCCIRYNQFYQYQEIVQLKKMDDDKKYSYIFGTLGTVIIILLSILIYYCYKKRKMNSSDGGDGGDDDDRDDRADVPIQKANELYEEDEGKTKENYLQNKMESEKKLDNLNERKKKMKEGQINTYINKAETEYTKSKCLAQIALEGKNKVIFIGNTGVGKSSLINKLFKLNLKTGKLQTTFGYNKVYNIQNTNIDIYDSQGYNQDNHDQQVKKWEQLNYYKIIFILYQDTLKASKTMIECICKPKDRVYKVYFVCTKCDLWDDSNNKTMDEETEQQRKYLKSIGIPDVDKIQFFKSSARKDKFDAGVNENQKIAKLIDQLSISYDLLDHKTQKIDKLALQIGA